MLFVLLFILTSSVVLYLPLYAAETTYQHPTHHLTLTSPPPIQKRNAPPPSTSYAQNSFKTADQHYFKDSQYMQSISWEEIQAICYNKSSEQLFNDFSYYANSYYLYLIGQKQGYEDFILILHQRYTDDHDYRKTLRCIKGFYPYQFLKLIDAEYDRIKALRQECDRQKQRDAQKKPDLARGNCLQVNNSNDYQIFINQCGQESSKAQAFGNQALINRYQKRIAAAQKASAHHIIYDYSGQLKSYPAWNDPDAAVFNNSIGTTLDQQLHEELCDIRLRIHELSFSKSAMEYKQIYAPIIYRCTALAKQEKSISIAFSLADFSDAVVRILSRGIQFISNVSSGPMKGLKMIAQDVSSSKYWTELVTTMPNFIINVLPTLLAQSPELLKQGIIFAAHEQSFWDRLDQTYILGDYELLDKRSKAYAEESREQLKPIDKRFKQLASMSWEDLGKYGTYYGGRLVLDVMACRAFALAASAAGRELTNTIAHLLESSKAPERLAEVANVGKLIIQEGPEVAPALSSSIKMASCSNDEYRTLKNTINLASNERTQHILYGDKTGGGHMWPGKTGKSIFPRSWDADKIMHYVSDIATDPNIKPIWTRGAEGSLFTKSGIPSRYYVDGFKDGIKIRVILEPANGKIITAFPMY